MTQKIAQIDPKNQTLKSGLYLVATPIGNMRDISFRALDVLSSVDAIACEDTRITGKLLNAYRIKKPMVQYNDHNAARQRTKIMQDLAEGKRIALVSDAGTPLISDPGYKLVREARDQGFSVTAIPGANAVLTALQVSGLPSDAFSFIGFLPAKTTARKKMLEEWSAVPGSLVIYETAPRLEESLADMLTVLGNRQAAVTRELTKMFEEVQTGSLEELVKHYKKKGAPKGEIVVVVSSESSIAFSKEEEMAKAVTIEDQLRVALKSMSVKDAAEAVALASGKPKKTIYTLALKLSGKS